MFFKANYFLSLFGGYNTLLIMKYYECSQRNAYFQKRMPSLTFLFESLRKKSSSFVLRVNCTERKSTIDPLMRCHFLASNPLASKALQIGCFDSCSPILFNRAR